VARPVVQETTALGAAYIAGLAESVWASPEEVASRWTLDRRFEPRLTPAEADVGHARWRRAVERSRGWAT
jgi:glycerol kinase